MKPENIFIKDGVYKFGDPDSIRPLTDKRNTDLYDLAVILYKCLTKDKTLYDPITRHVKIDNCVADLIEENTDESLALAQLIPLLIEVSKNENRPSKVLIQTAESILVKHHPDSTQYEEA